MLPELFSLLSESKDRHTKRKRGGRIAFPCLCGCRKLTPMSLSALGLAHEQLRATNQSSVSEQDDINIHSWYSAAATLVVIIIKTKETVH